MNVSINVTYRFAFDVLLLSRLDFMQASCMLASDLMILGRESISKELLVPLVESLSKSGHQSSGTVYCMLKNAEVLSIMGNSDKR